MVKGTNPLSGFTVVGLCLMLDSKWSLFCAASGFTATLSWTKLSGAICLLLKVSSQPSPVVSEVRPELLALFSPYKLLFR